MIEPRSSPIEQAPLIQKRALGIGIVALLVCVLAAPLSPAQFFRAYLSAYMFWLGIGPGCLVILMIYHLTGGAWGFMIRRILEAGTRTLPLLALLFVPIACGLGHLYPWARPDLVAQDANLQHKKIYLNPPFFWIRAAFYFACWIGVAQVLESWRRRQEHTTDPGMSRKLGGLSGPGLVIHGLVITFASVDWVMSLQPAFHSTIFGPLVGSGQVLSALALGILVLTWQLPHSRVKEVLSPDLLNDLGNLLLTFLVIWAYMVFFQFMLIWIANLPTDVIWYAPLMSGGWHRVSWALFILHFAVPFFLLLSRDVKRDPNALAAVAGLIFFMQLVFNYYQVMPVFSDSSPAEHWMDFLTPLGIGGIWLAYFLRQLQRYPMLPSNDLNAESAIHLRALDRAESARKEELSHG